MKENNYVLHTRDGVQLLTESQAINNALKQEKSGISPRYAFRDHKTGERLACMVNLCGRVRGCLPSPRWQNDSYNRFSW